MASGTLGQSNLSAATNTTVYTVPSAKVATISVNFCNNSSNIAVVRLAVCTNSTPTSSEYIEYDAILPANTIIERTGIVASADKKIVTYSSIANVSVNVYGFEE